MQIGQLRTVSWIALSCPGAWGGKSWKEEALASVCSGRLLISHLFAQYQWICFRLAAYRDVVADILFGAGQVTFDLFHKNMLNILPGERLTCLALPCKV